MENVVSELGRISTILGTSTKACMSKNLVSTERFSNDISREVSSLLKSFETDRNIQRNFNSQLIATISDASNRIAEGTRAMESFSNVFSSEASSLLNSFENDRNIQKNLSRQLITSINNASNKLAKGTEYHYFTVKQGFRRLFKICFGNSETIYKLTLLLQI